MKKVSRKEAIGKINTLFSDAQNIASTNISFANKFVAKARRIAMKSRIRLPAQLKRRFCKNCHIYFIPGKNYKVRTKNKKVIYTCLSCKHITRIQTKTKPVQHY